jgi:hypothetical protein
VGVPRGAKVGRPIDEASWGRVPSARGQGGEGAPKPVTDRTVSVTPWWKDPLPGSQDFLTILKTTPLGAGPGLTIKPAGLVTQLQQGYLAVITFITIFIDAPTTTVDVDWILLINDAPVPGWTMSTFPRNASNLDLGFEGPIRVPEGGQISMAIRNNEATARVVGAMYRGWQTSRTLIDTTFGIGSIT